MIFLTDQISYHAKRGEHAERHFVPIVSEPHVKIENRHFACERNKLDKTTRSCCVIAVYLYRLIIRYDESTYTIIKTFDLTRNKLSSDL